MYSEKAIGQALLVHSRNVASKVRTRDKEDFKVSTMLPLNKEGQEEQCFPCPSLSFQHTVCAWLTSQESPNPHTEALS